MLTGAEALQQQVGVPTAPVIPSGASTGWRWRWAQTQRGQCCSVPWAAQALGVGSQAGKGCAGEALDQGRHEGVAVALQQGWPSACQLGCGTRNTAGGTHSWSTYLLEGSLPAPSTSPTALTVQGLAWGFPSAGNVGCLEPGLCPVP